MEPQPLPITKCEVDVPASLEKAVHDPIRFVSDAVPSREVRAVKEVKSTENTMIVRPAMAISLPIGLLTGDGWKNTTKATTTMPTMSALRDPVAKRPAPRSPTRAI